MRHDQSCPIERFDGMYGKHRLPVGFATSIADARLSMIVIGVGSAVGCGQGRQESILC